MIEPFTIDASIVINAFNPAEAGNSESQRFLAHLRKPTGKAHYFSGGMKGGFS